MKTWQVVLIVVVILLIIGYMTNWFGLAKPKDKVKQTIEDNPNLGRAQCPPCEKTGSGENTGFSLIGGQHGYWNPKCCSPSS